MALELHKYILREQRLVQIESQATITFYEGESAEAANPGIWTYVVYDCVVGEEEVVPNPDINTLAPVLKLRQLVENMEDSSSAKLIPNAENAVVDIRKLRDYCLKPEHDEGKHKARLFSSILGMTAENAEELRQILTP